MCKRKINYVSDWLLSVEKKTCMDPQSRAHTHIHRSSEMLPLSYDRKHRQNSTDVSVKPN
jgi:hypothetical protein